MCDLWGAEAERGWLVRPPRDSWTDRIKILAWDESLALIDEAHVACGAAHVQQLVVHWMTMGSLDYPFATAPESRTVAKVLRIKKICKSESDVGGTRVVGELAVHRESLERILQENPESLAAILNALMAALTNKEDRDVEPKEEFEESLELCELTEV